MNELRKMLAICSIIIGGAAIGIPDLVYSKFFMALATSLNAASLYLLKEETPDATRTNAAHENS